MPDATHLPAPWLHAVTRPEVVAALQAVHQLVADQIEARNPACWGSGRCCNFKDSGHLLYTTGLEAAWTVSQLPPDSALTRPALDAAIARGDCPFLTMNLCGVHLIKPAACRIYFCDESAQAWQHDLSETAHRMVRDLHQRFNIDYRYAEWRTLLGMFLP